MEYIHNIGRRNHSVCVRLGGNCVATCLSCDFWVRWPSEKPMLSFFFIAGRCMVWNVLKYVSFLLYKKFVSGGERSFESRFFFVIYYSVYCSSHYTICNTSHQIIYVYTPLKPSFVRLSFFVSSKNMYITTCSET